MHDEDEIDSDVVLDAPAPSNGRKGQRRAGLVDLELCLGLARTVMCGGWMFVTSRDQHDLHDLAMIVYMLLDVPWFYLSWAHSTNARAKRWRAICASGFFAMLPGLIYLFIQHNVKRVPGGALLVASGATRRTADAEFVKLTEQRTRTTRSSSGPSSPGMWRSTPRRSSSSTISRSASWTRAGPRSSRTTRTGMSRSMYTRACI